MSSSFKRRRGKKVVSPPIPSSQASASSNSNEPTKISSSLLPGTKHWTNNLTLTSFGLREIDSFFFSSGGGNDAGGGQPLQTCVMLEEDRLTDDIARALSRYWCAEGVAQRQMVLMASLLPGADASLQLLDDDGTDSIHSEGSTPDELHDFILSLPRNLHLDKFRAKEAKKHSSNAVSSTTKENAIDGNDMMSSNNRESISAIIEEDEEEEEEEDQRSNDGEVQQSKDEGLINAWQYRKSVQDARSGIGNHGTSTSEGQSSSVGDGVYCHSYDLSKRMWDQFASTDERLHAEENPLVANTKVVDCSHALKSSSTSGNWNMVYQQHGMVLFCSLWKHIHSALAAHPKTVIRLFLHRLPVGQGAVALPLLMSKIRKENLPVIVLATIRPWRWLSSSSLSSSNSMNKLDTLASLRSSTDATLSLDSFSSLRTPPPPEFSLLQGILTVRKCASFTVSHYTDTVTWKRPLAERFGVKRDGRKVTVQLLHLPPEEYSKGGSSTSGVRSGGGNTDDSRKEPHKHAAGGCSSLAGGASLDF